MRYLLLLACLTTAAGADETLHQKIDARFDTERARINAPGVSIAVVKDGRVIYAKASGVLSVETKAPASPDSLFRIASTTKMFTAAALNELAEAGKVDLHRPIGAYAPKLQKCLADVTLHQLLSHTAGIRDDAPMEGPHDDAALAQTVLAWGSDVCFAPPGRVFSYSNLGYALAGYILEQVSGKPFADAVRDLVLLPAGMRTSTFRPFVAMTYPLALGHQPSDRLVRPQPDHAGAWPAGSLFSSANEIARFMIALLDKGLVGDKQTLSAAAVARMQTPFAKSLAIGREYGYGLQLLDEDGHPVIRHTGGRTGYGSVIHMLPKSRVGVVVLANAAVIPNQLARDVARLAANITERPGERHLADQEIPPVERKRLIGTYINSANIRTTLAERDGGVQLQFGGRWFPVRSLGPGRYGAAGAMQLSDFRIVNDANGAPEYLVAEMWALRRVPESKTEINK